MITENSVKSLSDKKITGLTQILITRFLLQRVLIHFWFLLPIETTMILVPFCKTALSETIELCVNSDQNYVYLFMDLFFVVHI